MTFLTKQYWCENKIAGITKMAEYVLTKNVLTFNNDLYLQIQGTAMGTKMAPAFANIFMAEFENSALTNAPIPPEIWWRYIDDCFIIWQHGLDQLQDFLQFINNLHPTIKFTADWSDTSIAFLDVRVYVSPDRTLSTDSIHETY